MELVDATSDDLDTLLDYWYALAEGMEQYDDLNELAYESVADASTDGFAAHLDADADDVTDFLVHVDGETVGFVTLREGTHPSREYARFLRIVNRYVEPAHRNAGVGTATLDRVRELARDRGCDHLNVSCEWENDGARRFYEDCGVRPKQVDYAETLE